MRVLWLGVVVWFLCGCAAAPTRPSTVAERTATPESITRDNPGGDAQNPTDAALTRLLREPIGYKTDKFRTLRAHFADVKNWKRVRFFGHPTRSGFRYGKNPAYAIGLIAYAPAEGDEAPHACLERFARRGRGIAKSFDIEVEPLSREVHEHYRGPESVDWVAREQEERKKREERKRAIERQKREREKRRQAWAAARKKREERARRRRMAARLRRAAMGSKRPPSSVRNPQGTAAKAARPPRPPRYVIRLRRAMRRAERRAHLVAHKEAAKGGGAKDAAAYLEFEVFVRGDDRRPPRVVVHPPSLAADRPKRPGKPPLPKRPPRKKPTPEQLWKQAWERQKKRYGVATMPVIRTAGEFQTLFDADRYLGAVAAYHSWPGTCLVQGFAVKVGSDEKLAEQVLQRWIEEMATRLMWEDRLRERPEFKNR